MNMNLQSLRELVESRKTGEVATRPDAGLQSIRVSGGMFGPDRAFKERLSFYGKSCFAISYPGPRSETL
jgi:hypothetical protein